MKLSEALFRDDNLPEPPRRKDALDVADTIFAAMVLIGIIAIAIDLAVRAADPYDIKKPRQRASSDLPARAGHYVAPTPVADLSEQAPFGIKSSRDTEVPYGPVTAYASQLSPEDLATRHSALATPKEVKPAPGRINPSSPVKPLVQTARGTTLSRAQLAAEVRAALPKLSNAEVDAAVWIIWRESGGRTTAKNPRSSSHGLNGFLRSTWRNVTSRSGIRHGLDPRSQIHAMHHYVTRRYGSFRRAKAHHVARRWY